jgi:hypothetical protein
VDWPESGPGAPRGCGRIKLRKIQAGADDFTAVLFIEMPLLVLFAVAPAIRLSMPLEPAMSLPFVNRDGPQRLFNLAQRSRSSATSLKRAAVMHDGAADHTENRLQHGPLRMMQSAFAQHIVATPTPLVWLWQSGDRVSLLAQSIVFPDSRDNLLVRDFMGIQHRDDFVV